MNSRKIQEEIKKKVSSKEASYKKFVYQRRPDNGNNYQKPYNDNYKNKVSGKKMSYKKMSYKKGLPNYKDYLIDPIKYIPKEDFSQKTIEDLKKNDYKSFEFTENYNRFVKNLKSEETQIIMKRTGLFLIIVSGLAIANKEVFETIAQAFTNVYKQDQIRDKKIYQVSYTIIKEYIKLLRNLSHIRKVYHVATLIYIFFEGIPYAYMISDKLKSENFLKIIQNLLLNLVKTEDIALAPTKKLEEIEKEVAIKKEETNKRLQQTQLLRAIGDKIEENK